MKLKLTMRLTQNLTDLTHPAFWLMTTALTVSWATPGLAQEPAVKSGDSIAFMGGLITAGDWKSPVGYVRLVVAGGG